MKQYEIIDGPLNIHYVMEFVLHPGAGAVTMFTGHVREWTQGVRTLYLAYEAYVPMAEKKRARVNTV